MDLKASDMTLLYNASKIPSALMYDALLQQDYLCRVFGKCLAGDPFDREVGDLIDAKGPVQSKLFTYMRYNAELTYAGLAELGLDHIEPRTVQQFDSIEYVKDLQRIGIEVAKQKMNPDHFMDFLK
jgi:hypothetical protein